MNSQKIYERTAVLLIAAILVFLVIFPKDAKDAALDGYNLWLSSVFPALFPFFVISSCMNRVGISEKIAPVFSCPMNKIFKVSGSGAFAYITGIFSGNPIGAKSVCDAYGSRNITKDEAQTLLALCANTSPMFVIVTVGITFFNSGRIALVLLAINYLSAFLSGAFASIGRKNPEQKLKIANVSAMPFAKAFTLSVKESIINILNVGGFIIFFQVVSVMVSGVISFAEGGIADTVLKSALEVTDGCKAAGVLMRQTPVAALTIASGAISFGGISVFFQCLSFIADTDLSISAFFKAKLVQTAFGAALGYACASFIPESVLCISRPAYVRADFMPLLLLTGFICMILISVFISNKKGRQLAE